MSLPDCRDIAVSTDNRSSLEHLELATELLHGFYGDPLGVIDQALADDPRFAMGYAFRAGLLITASDKSVEPLLRQSVESAEALVDEANDRERRHTAAARSWLDGNFERAIQQYGEIAVEYPRDSFALQIAHIGDFLLGQSTMLRDRIAQVFPYWDKDIPGFGFILGMHAFGLEETNLFHQAEDTGNKALALNPRDPWAIHAVAHVMEMQGRQEDGIHWLSCRANDWSEDNMFAVHNWWHLGLFYLDLDETEEVLRLYDSRIRRNRSDVALDLVDASAMLWRLLLRGIDTGNRWSELADVYEAKQDVGYYAFNDVHALMAFVGAKRESAAQQRIACLQKAASGTGTNAAMTKEVGLPVGEALVAFGHGDYATASERLLSVRSIAHRFGGSNAQRDILHLTLLESAFRANRLSLASALASERLSLKASSPFNRKTYQRALTGH